MFSFCPRPEIFYFYLQYVVSSTSTSASNATNSNARPLLTTITTKPKEGYVEKLDRGGWFKRWQRRYFVLRADTLQWYACVIVCDCVCVCVCVRAWVCACCARLRVRIQPVCSWFFFSSSVAAPGSTNTAAQNCATL